MFIKKYREHIEYYNEFSRLHRNNNPAIIIFNEAEYWYNNGLLHNENGPSIRMNATNEEKYFIFGVKIKKEDLNAPINFLKLKYEISL